MKINKKHFDNASLKIWWVWHAPVQSHTLLKIVPVLLTHPVFEDISFLTKKQRTQSQNLTSHKKLASFGTIVDPEVAKVRNAMVWRSFKPVWPVQRVLSRFQSFTSKIDAKTQGLLRYRTARDYVDRHVYQSVWLYSNRILKWKKLSKNLS